MIKYVLGHMLGLLLAMLLAAQGLAQTPPATARAAATNAAAPQADNAFLAPFIDDQTIIVAHLDAAKIDTAALDKYVTSLLDEAKVPTQDEMRSGLAAAHTAADVFLARFKQLGGRHVYALLSHPDLWPHMQPLAVLVKIEPGGDAAQMKELLTSTFGMARLTPGDPGPQELASGTPEAVMLRDNVLFIGQDAALQRLRGLKPTARPELALGQYNTNAVDVVLELEAAPTSDERRAIRDLMPALPAEAGGGSTDFLTRGPMRMQLLVQLPPKPVITLSLTPSPSPNEMTMSTITNGNGWLDPQQLSARFSEIDALVARLRDLFLQSPDFIAAMNDPILKPHAAELTAGIKELVTSVNGTLTLDDKHIRLMVPLLNGALQQARQNAQRAASAANLRQIAQAAIVYAMGNRNVLPESLDVLVKNNQLSPKMIVNPADGKPYVYRVIILTSDTLSDVPLAWEQTDGDHLNVAFGDGHVEWIDRKSFDNYVKQAEEKKAKLDAQKKGGQTPGLP